MCNIVRSKQSLWLALHVHELLHGTLILIIHSRVTNIARIDKKYFRWNCATYSTCKKDSIIMTKSAIVLGSRLTLELINIHDVVLF